MATKVNISKSLEAAIRREVEKGAGSPLVDIVKLLDETKKRAAGSNPGLGYKELVALFRFALGPDLVVPMNPSTGYIVRLVNRAKDLGIVKENVEQIARGVRRGYRPPYSLDFVISRADRHYQLGDGDVQKSVQPEDTAQEDRSVFIGRPIFDDE
jgi:hypothetical protein